MSGTRCGCTTSTCGCCEGTRVLTPLSVENAPGASELVYRAGRHREFFESMKARLATTTVDAPGKDGQTIETFRPLQGLTTRETTDPSIALLDAWATVADVLTFYQERIANEGFLRTATERRSVLELAKLVGYTLRPGVASTVYLAYTLEDSQADPVQIEVGRRSQSIPGPGEFPQFFETAEQITARREWNDLTVLTTRPQSLDLSSALVNDVVWVAGTSTNLRKGDQLLFELQKGKAFVVRTVERIDPDFEAKRTAIRLFIYPGTAASIPLLLQFIEDARKIVASSGGLGASFVDEADRIVQDLLYGMPSDPLTWVAQMIARNDGAPPHNLEELVKTLDAEIAAAVGGKSEPVVANDVSLIRSLLTPPNEQRRSRQALDRSLSTAFAAGSDTNAQLLVNFAPSIRRSYYAAWAGANATDTTADVTAVFAVRVSAQLFGATVSKMATFDGNNRLNKPSEWEEWTLDPYESPDGAYLDQGYDDILPGSYVIIETGEFQRTRSVLKVKSTSTAPRTAYATSGKSTHLTLSGEWWEPSTTQDISQLRSTQIFGQTEPLELVDEPVVGAVAGREIELQQLYDGLESGRWVILAGERTDIAGTSGVTASELHMLSDVRSTVDSTRANDRLHTTITLATPAAYRYKRATLKIYGNVIKATNGETRQETLGSGDAAQSLQSFSLKQPPLTFVAAPTPSGVASTLQVYVNDVRWHERPSLVEAVPTDRAFVTDTDDAGVTRVIFGNGREGARLPTGVENVRAIYRTGIGKAGNVQAGQISLVQTAPLGIRAVLNPLRASGGANAEDRDQARENVPLAVMALDRLVSMQDYEDFARTFAGIAKARVARLTDGQREFLHLTIAGADDIPIDPTSDLYRNLVLALRRFGDPDLPVRVDTRELVALVLSAGVRIGADYVWETVSDAMRAVLLERFGFARRALAQAALRSEVIAAMQSVRGVAYVDLDTFGGVAEKITITSSEGPSIRRLRTPAELSAAVAALTATTSGFRHRGKDMGVAADAAHVDEGQVVPAQLAVFSPGVPDTLILNQIS